MDSLYFIKDYFKIFVDTTATPVGFYSLWMCANYVASYFYNEYCVPKTLLGFLMSPILTVTPICKSLLWVQTNSVETMSNMWVAFGTWITLNILKTKL